MSALRPAFSLALAGALMAAVGCYPPGGASDTEKVISRIESGRHRADIPPTTLVSAPRKLYKIGEDVNITIRVIAPVEDKALDPYLPITGRFHVKREGALSELRPPASTAKLAWVKIPLDDERARERSFTVAINRVFPMTAVSWYTIWWEGRDDLRHNLMSTSVNVRVMTEVPKE